MHFGRLDQIEKNLTIPPEGLRTTRFLNLPRQYSTKVYIGCPIWATRSWVGSLYPKGTKSSEFLREYALNFNTVEINSTFYHLLEADRLKQWQEQVPANFRFCPKVFRGITEELASRELPRLIERFCNSIRALTPNLGLTFAQFSEAVGPRQSRLLERFCNLWPNDLPLAIELRHPGWFYNHTLPDELVNFLYRRNMSTVITDTPGRRDVLHLSLTHPKVMIRFQGQTLDPSDEQRINEWIKKLSQWAGHHLEEIYFITHQPGEDLIPQTAALVQKRWQQNSSN